MELSNEELSFEYTGKRNNQLSGWKLHWGVDVFLFKKNINQKKPKQKPGQKPPNQMKNARLKNNPLVC